VLVLESISTSSGLRVGSVSRRRAIWDSFGPKSRFFRGEPHADRCLAPVLSAVHSVISPPCTDSLASAQPVSPGCAARAARGSARCVSVRLCLYICRGFPPKLPVSRSTMRKPDDTVGARGCKARARKCGSLPSGRALGGSGLAYSACAAGSRLLRGQPARKGRPSPPRPHR
jgi:hypothetical protein